MKKVIQDIWMGLIIVFMCLIFGRTTASGSNNLAWLLIVVLVNIAVIIYDLKDYALTIVKQLVITAPLIITLVGQVNKVYDGRIPETYQVLWQNYAIAFVICAFNIATCWMNWNKEDDFDNPKIASIVCAVFSGIAMIVMACVLVSKI